ncbi:DUF2290 domain-containing protein [Brevibacillus humidisoli]|uniref:DUF2290 domain-containing protein n=1 Tax=Brevibacillus humidisoli TaxID=2895522 RepID=UPI001E4D6C3F|nr:DUF2290 domain-containing protein [Brevibacillus humidisoli]UFJ41362.1 DUF2290 domain-containing protein [Brevibacillus humidisoli]
MSSISQLLYTEVMDVTTLLISFNLSIDQNFPSNREIVDKGTVFEVIDWGKTDTLSIVFKNVEYKVIYDELNNGRNFNIKMIDGALIQLMYKAKRNEIVSHRLAFFPNPYLEKFQNDPEIYEKADLYADILAKNIVPVPIRFDFNADVHDEMHAMSHASFGQYKNCRIPVCSPLTPSKFIDFILRNFYSSAYREYRNDYESNISFGRTITSDEEKLVHFNF